MRGLQNLPIVAERNFILAAREVGYRSPSDALAELIDNSIQAHSNRIDIFVHEESNSDRTDLRISVLDDGCGMGEDTLREALRFGGTNRFDDRSGLGRFGMGLPSSSVSQARRVDVYSWTNPVSPLHIHLDVDEIASGRTRVLSPPRRASLPEWVVSRVGATGTLVVWRKCDRTGFREPVAFERAIRRHIGRIFRHFIWRGLKILINDSLVQPIDPLFCHADTPLSGATEYSAPLVYNVRIPREPSKCSQLKVRFSELPIVEWYGLPVEDKRKYGIVKGAGVSLVRAGREIAYGWHFMGQKRKENYDDWWRCEVSFQPELDEYFRPTHTKQAISPSSEIEVVLTPDLEAIAHTLNSRVRKAYSTAKGRIGSSAAALVSARDDYLPMRPRRNTPDTHSFSNDGLKYSLTIAPLREESFYAIKASNGTLALVLNQNHPFYERIYSPLSNRFGGKMRFYMDCFLFALARAESNVSTSTEKFWRERKRIVWSNILAAFLGS